MKRLLDILTLLDNHGAVAGGELAADHGIIWFSGPELSDDELETLVDTEVYAGGDPCIEQLIALGAFWDTGGDSWAVFT